MIITRLYLGDFGIFQNQLMENISPGLVVVGGPNRAGKTTLMNVLRYLGFGVPKNASIPAAIKYEISAGAEHGENKYRITLDGHAGPKVFLPGENEDSTEVDIKELYGSIDDFSYRQIFTISLDELRQIPEGLSKNDEGKLSAVLLGAGWSDSFKLIELKEAFNTAAHNIGASKGAVGARKFKDYNKELNEGLELREQANARLDEYHSRKLRFGELNDQVREQEQQLEEARKELQRLDLLERHFERLRSIVEIKTQLKEPGSKKLLESYPAGGLHEAAMLKNRYATVVENYNQAVDHFTVLTGQPTGSQLYAGLLHCAEELDELGKKMSGWREALKNFNTKSRELAEKEKNLSENVRNVYDELPESQALSLMEKVKTDGLNLQELVSSVDRFKKCRDQLEAKEYELKDLEAEREQKVEQKEKLPRPSGSLFQKVLWAVGLDAAAVIVLYFLLTPAVAVTVGALLGIGILAYLFRQGRQDQLMERQYHEIEKAISDLEHQQKYMDKRHKELADEFQEIKGEIESLANSLNIPGQIQVDYLPHFTGEASKIQKEYRAIQAMKEELQSIEEDLRKDLSSAVSVLQSAVLLKEELADCISDAETIFSALEKALDYLRAARDVKNKETAKKEVEKEIISLLRKENPGLDPDFAQQSPGALLEEFYLRGQEYGELVAKEEQCRKAEQFLLEELRAKKWQEQLLGENDGLPGSDDALLQSFGKWCEWFTGKEEIDEKLEIIKEETRLLNRDIEETKKEIWQVERDLEDLATDEKIREANNKINEARRKLAPLAEEYAVNRAAQYMVEKAYYQLLEKTKNELLAPAGTIFSKITGGDYSEVEPPRETSKPEFAVKLSDGRYQEADKLSRATREQLFLAVRLSRIAAIKPELPVILDDTLANFDPVHTREAVKYISELSRTHQVFVFTCHPQLIEYLHGSDCSTIQYWGLVKGSVSGPYDDCTEITDMLWKQT